MLACWAWEGSLQAVVGHEQAQQGSLPWLEVVNLHSSLKSVNDRSSGKLKDWHGLGEKNDDGLHSLVRKGSRVPAGDDCFVELPGRTKLPGGPVAASDPTDRTKNAHRATVVSCQNGLPSACAILLLRHLLLHDAVRC